jgi:hypothetical protein
MQRRRYTGITYDKSETYPLENQKGHRRLAVFRLGALAGSLLTH